jgi:hypothetical protein
MEDVTAVTAAVQAITFGSVAATRHIWFDDRSEKPADSAVKTAALAADLEDIQHGFVQH